MYSGLASPDLASTSTCIRATRLIETSLQSTSALGYFQDGFAVGLYCSDVSGAFEHVCRARLCEKLRVSVLVPEVISFLESWLEDRVACAVVAGAKSEDEVLANSVVQGTVLGPPLWNFFYASTPTQGSLSESMALLKQSLPTISIAGPSSTSMLANWKPCLNCRNAKVVSIDGGQQTA